MCACIVLKPTACKIILNIIYQLLALYPGHGEGESCLGTRLMVDKLCISDYMLGLFCCNVAYKYHTECHMTSQVTPVTVIIVHLTS